MIDTEYNNSIGQDIAEDASLGRELSFLFSEDIVEQTCLIDIADLNSIESVSSDFCILILPI